ncbi:hypothetical protein QAD02_013015 [Eretmocerus hayati]|uniref:Uncharacterized protein n=1 Tax=Eretmocerus hayati TaxID=131215 RepID=A0ACC2P192_9HYME|nr:hypothetical protein QAD02_013015 [Eretmocerus hayati]
MLRRLRELYYCNILPGICSSLSDDPTSSLHADGKHLTVKCEFLHCPKPKPVNRPKLVNKPKFVKKPELVEKLKVATSPEKPKANLGQKLQSDVVTKSPCKIRV